MFIIKSIICQVFTFVNNFLMINIKFIILQQFGLQCHLGDDNGR